jgi:hypothetical protein
MTKATKARGALVLVAGLFGCDGGSPPAPPRSGVDADAATIAADASAADAQVAPDTAPASPRITLTDSSKGSSQVKWVAASDGDGPWQRVEGTGKSYSFEVKGSRYGLAIVCAAEGGAFGELVHATVAELPGLAVDCSTPPLAMTRHKVSGKVTGLGAGATLELQAGDGAYTVTVTEAQPTTTTMYQIDLPPATYDMAAIASLAGKPTHAVLRRDLALGADTVIDLDFAAPGAAMGASGSGWSPPGPRSWPPISRARWGSTRPLQPPPSAPATARSWSCSG